MKERSHRPSRIACIVCASLSICAFAFSITVGASDCANVLREADHLVLVVPYSPSSHHAIGAAELAQMKRTAMLTNIARGGIVDDAALAAALRERRIAAAGLDVFEGEPAVHPDLLKVPDVVLTPHIGSASVNTRRAMAALAVDNLIAALGCGPQAGHPPTPVNTPSPSGRA
jgi:gluconate 2-dehydrogenase